MNTVSKLINIFDRGAVWEDMKEILREVDRSYSAEEEAYVQGLQRLRQLMPPEREQEAMELVALKQEETAAALMFLLWNGLHLNLECFRNPAAKLFLALDHETLLQEGVMQSMPASRNCQTRAGAFFRSLSDEQYELFEPVNSYYNYIKTVAYKLAHYYGFILGDQLLPGVIPGYVPDPVLNAAYAADLRNVLSMEL